MANWFTELFGRAADAIGNGVGDIRDKLVFESFFGRHVPERHSQDDLGWFQDRPSGPDRTEGNALDRFYDRLSPAERAEHFRDPSAQDRSIER